MIDDTDDITFFRRAAEEGRRAAEEGLKHIRLVTGDDGSVVPAVEGITEVPGWEGPTRIIILTTSDGVRQWRCEGLASNITPEALELLENLREDAEERRRPALVMAPTS